MKHKIFFPVSLALILLGILYINSRASEFELMHTENTNRIAIDFSTVCFNITTMEIDTNARTLYDLQSNSCTRYIWQDPNNPLRLFAVFMVDKIGAGPGFPDRRVNYFYSSNGGNNWSYTGNVSSYRSGYPCLGLQQNSAVCVAMNNIVPGSNGSVHIYAENIPGYGNFQRIDTEVILATNQKIGSTINTSSILKILTLGVLDSLYLFRKTDNNTSYSAIRNINSATNGNISVSENGTIGISYISSAPTGTIFFINSTDNGTTFSTPVPVWFPKFINGDSLGGLRGLDLTFKNNTPYVVFEIGKRFINGFYPKEPSLIYCWSPNLNGGNPVKIDSAGGLTGSNPVNDVFLSCSRPVIGITNDGVLLTAYCRARPDTDNVGNNYYDIWLAASTDNGNTWCKGQITNTSGPLRDNRYVSISPLNQTSPNGFVHLGYQSDSIPGSYVDGSNPSFARFMYARVTLTLNEVKNISTSAEKFSLEQNYPNPFNPSTQIKFSIPEKSFVTLKIYSAEGKEIKQFVNQYLNSGLYNIDFDGTGLTSGVYFYKLEVSSSSGKIFNESKKMILIK